MTPIKPAARFLMCRPEHFAVSYAINPWMDPKEWAQGATALQATAARQWSELGTWMLRHEEVQTKLQGSSANAAFAFGFWNNHAAASPAAREVDVEAMLDKKWSKQSWRNACLCRAAPADLIACIGSYGQRLYIVPSKSLVIVRLAKDAKPNDAQMLRLLFAKKGS